MCPASGSGDINTSVTVPVGASVVFTATGTVDPAATGDLVNSAQVLPPAGHANRTSAIATDSDPITARADLGITKTGPASIVAGNPLVYTITVHQHRAVGRRGRGGERCHADWPGVRVECRRLHDGLPVRARRRARRRHPHDHRDLQRADHVSRPGADRERRQRVVHHAR